MLQSYSSTHESRVRTSKRTNLIRRENLRRLGACHKQSLESGTNWRRNLGAAHGHKTGISGKRYRRNFVGSTWSISYVLRRGGSLRGCTF